LIEEFFSMDLGAVFLTLAVALLVAVFISRPFLSRRAATEKLVRPASEEREVRRSTLLAERDRVLTALQDLDFDFTLGKIPAEDYPVQREQLLQTGANVLRGLDELSGDLASQTAEDRVEAAVAARRADSSARRVERQPELAGAASALSPSRRPPAPVEDEVEAMVSARRQARQEKAAGFCPKCGRPVAKSDRFCSRCGTTL
jgi:hypothetical protein